MWSDVNAERSEEPVLLLVISSFLDQFLYLQLKAHHIQKVLPDFLFFGSWGSPCGFLHQDAYHAVRLLPR